MSCINHAALTLQVFSCLYLARVILVIHLTHNQAFSQIDRTPFVTFRGRHSAALGLIGDHHRLAGDCEEQDWRSLIRGNWVRTVILHGRSIAFLILALQYPWK